jgi:glycosyltransferase involved in cell wall biosynthesis
VNKELTVVVPARNESACIRAVLDEWFSAIQSTKIPARFIVLDDGSSDETPRILREWSADKTPESCIAVSHQNIGHGQTCMKGYRMASALGTDWILQIDSDGQCDPAFFPAVWQAREGCDVVYGNRTTRLDGWRRVLASKVLKFAVKLSSGAACPDANVPYRLMRAEKLPPILDSIPGNFDLANIALAVQLQRSRWRERAVPIVFRERFGGEPSVPLARFALKGLELFRQLGRLPPPPCS